MLIDVRCALEAGVEPLLLIKKLAEDTKEHVRNQRMFSDGNSAMGLYDNEGMYNLDKLKSPILVTELDDVYRNAIYDITDDDRRIDEFVRRNKIISLCNQLVELLETEQAIN